MLDTSSVELPLITNTKAYSLKYLELSNDTLEISSGAGSGLLVADMPFNGPRCSQWADPPV